MYFKDGKAAASIIAPDSKAKIEAFAEEQLAKQEVRQWYTYTTPQWQAAGPAAIRRRSAARAGFDTVVLEKLSAGGLDPDAAGYIIADESTRTNLPGVFAVGDVRTKPVRQMVTAVADGAVAAHCAEALKKF